LKILEYTHDQFADAFRRRYGKGTHVSTPVYRHVMKTGQTAFHELAAFSRFSGLARQVSTELALSSGRLVKRVADGDVVKFITRLADDLDIESVVIPMFRRHTLCVSSQVGCRMGCRFCRTGQMGLLRNLSSGNRRSGVCRPTPFGDRYPQRGFHGHGRTVGQFG
jgi:23S rRNA (adenine2503-C2)-methyltransferase